MAGKVFDGALEAAASVAGAARHLAWWFSYCLDASHARPLDEQPVGRPAEAGRRRAS